MEEFWFLIWVVVTELVEGKDALHMSVMYLCSLFKDIYPVNVFLVSPPCCSLSNESAVCDVTKATD